MSLTTAPSRIRLYALPLTRRPPNPSVSNATSLTYYWARMPKAPSPATTTSAEPGAAPPTPPIMKRVTTYANKTWDDWGKAQGGWKLKLHVWGEKVSDQIDFEEGALKGVDPAMGPSITLKKPLKTAAAAAQQEQSEHIVVKEVKKAVEAGEKVVVPLYYPPTILKEPLEDFKLLLAHRMPLHRRWMWIWAVAAPLTAPFAIVPVVPNIPFFFCCWRVWSHWRAYRGARFLDELVAHDCVVPTPHSGLDAFYKAAALKAQSDVPTPSEASSTSSRPSSALLLTRKQIPALVDSLRANPDGLSTSSVAKGTGELNPKLATLSVELARAVDQAVVRSAAPQ